MRTESSEKPVMILYINVITQSYIMLFIVGHTHSFINYVGICSLVKVISNQTVLTSGILLVTNTSITTVHLKE